IRDRTVTGVQTCALPISKTELPPVDTLKGLASEYKDFLRPGVDEKLRQSALKKLFHDPHFNVMDGLDTYIEDYSKLDPIPGEMQIGRASCRERGEMVGGR